MGNLRDQLLKAKLVNQKAVQEAERKERETRKEHLHKGVDQREVARQEKHQERVQQIRQEDKQREIERQSEAIAHNRFQIVKDLVTAGKIAGYGNKRYYFIASNNTIPFIEVSDELVKQLERGQAGIVELPGKPLPVFFVVNITTLKRIEELMPEIIRCNNRNTGEP